MASDSLVAELVIPPSVKGLLEGLDETLSDELYPLTAAPDLSNIRVVAGKWSTRKGQSLWKTLPGSGATRLLDNLYQMNGTRVRVAARGDANTAVFLDLVEGTDTEFQTTTGGTGLGTADQPRFQGVTLNDRFYFTDRAGPLRRYQPSPVSGNQVVSVVLPSKPAAAPGVKAKTWDILEAWTGNAGVAPFGWTVASSAAFDIEDGSATITSPLGGRTVLLNTKTNPKDQPISENVSSEAVPSQTIAFYVDALNLPTQIVFQYGQISATDFTEQITPPTANDWYPVFINLGNLGTINFKRWMVVKNAGASDTNVSKLVLPGRLQGAYRWVYTHYDPSTGRESEPSDISNGGTPLDLSMVGVSYQTGTAAAFQKSAALTFTSDSGTDASTTKIRVYRNGGVPSLTFDSRGRAVWLRVGEVFDQSTTLAGAHSAGATTVTVASATNLAVGDWLVIEKGVVSKEEYVRITVIVGTTLTISNGLQYSHADLSPVQVAFVDNVANESVDVTASIDLERDDPPDAARFVLVSPDGRLVLVDYEDHPTGIAWSNRATPERPTDYEVFPSGVDPLTRRSLIQGWQIELGGDTTDEEIAWGGYFRGELTILTKQRLYRIHASSQADWGPGAVDKTLEVGCIAGDTVREVQGSLYWVAPGPQVVKWDGYGAQPTVISHLRVNERLAAADVSSYIGWFAVAHPTEDGHYYRLYYGEEVDYLGVDGGPELLILYRFEDVPGFLLDEGDNGYTLSEVNPLTPATNLGLVTQVTGFFGEGARFTYDGITLNDYGTLQRVIGNVASLQVSHTIEYALKIVGADTASLVVQFQYQNPGGSELGWALGFASSGSDQIIYWSAANALLESQTVIHTIVGGLGDNNWHHIAAKVDLAGNVKLYLDGVSVHTEACTMTDLLMTPDAGSLLYITGTVNFTDANCDLDNLRWSSALDSDADILSRATTGV